MQKILVVIVLALGLSAAAYYSSKPVDAPVAPAATGTPVAATSSAPATSTLAAPAAKAVAPAPAATPAATSAPKPASQPAAEPAPEPGYTLAEVSLHASEASCWAAINGNVYDITAYFGEHPGGDRNLLRICGKDGTAAFEGQHGGESRPERILGSFLIGPLRT